MHSNQKLTRVIAGRGITGITTANGVATVAFSDGSQMTVRCAPGATIPTVPAGAPPVLTVQQDLRTLRLTLRNGATLDFPLAEPTSTVMVRDHARVMEYAD